MAFRLAEQGLIIERNEASLPVEQIAHGRSRPFYLYDQAELERRAKSYLKAFSRPVQVRFAVKANANTQLLQSLAILGVGADVVSLGELDRALASGIEPQHIVFSGVGKTSEELRRATQVGVGQINVESLGELDRMIHVAQFLKMQVSVGLRINPHVEVDTHQHIRTGTAINKFGMDMSDIPQALEKIRAEERLVRLKGLAAHVGSQILDVAPLAMMMDRLLELDRNVRGQGFQLETLDLGGGLGIDYELSSDHRDFERLAQYAALVNDRLAGYAGQILLEPGRFLVARAGALITQVEYLKFHPEKNFIIVNSGMNHLIRPALYGARHRTVIVPAVSGRVIKKFDVVGPLCESSDVLAKDIDLPVPKEGEWLAVLDAGAYGYSMASQYNLRGLPDEIVV